MKTITKLFSVFSTLILLVTCFALCVSAANSSAILYFSKNSIGEGDTLTVSVGLNPDVKMSNVSFSLKYDSEVLNFESGDGSLSSNGVVKVSKSAEGKKDALYKFTFTGLKEGKSAVSVVDCVYTTVDNGVNTQKNFVGASAVVSVKGGSSDDSAALESLKLKQADISPAFSESNTSYTAKVSHDVDKIELTATPSDKNAAIEIEGTDNLKIGENTVTVTVVAQNGKEKTYTIKVTRQQEAEDENESQETSSSTDEETQETVTTTNLKTIVDGKSYTIISNIPPENIFKGFEIEKTSVNGYDIDTAIDSGANYRIFYLMPADSKELVPFLYNAQMDAFEEMKYITIEDNTYIFDNLPSDISYPENLYPSNVSIQNFEVECIADTITEMNDFKFVYCFYNGNYGFYRYDTQEGTLQRYPDLNFDSYTEEDETDNVFSRFGSLSTNGKVIMVALLVVILGILSLLVLLIVYLIRRSMNKNDDILDYVDEDFDEIQITNDNTDE